MKKTVCKIAGCREEHHARGYCNRHYKKLMRYKDPLAGRFNEVRGPRTRKPKSEAIIMQTEPTQPEPRKKRGSGQGNYLFFLNQKFIEKLYNEAIKATHDPLYKANEETLPHILDLAAHLAGYDGRSRLFKQEFIEELKTWAAAKDKIRFMDALAHWEQRADDFKPRNTQQLSFFNVK